MDDNEQYERLLAEQRHTELIESLSDIKKLLSAVALSDIELQNIIKKNTEAINTFGKAPKVNVVSNQDQVVEAVKGLSVLFASGMAKMEERLNLMEDAMKAIAERPVPVRMKAERPNKYNDLIEFVVIEYKK